MRDIPSSRHSIDLLFSIAPMFIFAIASILLILSAGSDYASIVRNSSRNNNARTAIAYITEKVHQNDVGGNISIDEIDGQQAIIINQTIDGQEYKTYIYVYEGELKELFASPTFDPSLDDGSKIINIKSMDVKTLKGMKIRRINNSLIKLVCYTDDGNTSSTCVSIRS